MNANAKTHAFLSSGPKVCDGTFVKWIKRDRYNNTKGFFVAVTISMTTV